MASNSAHCGLPACCRPYDGPPSRGDSDYEREPRRHPDFDAGYRSVCSVSGLSWAISWAADWVFALFWVGFLPFPGATGCNSAFQPARRRCAVGGRSNPSISPPGRAAHLPHRGPPREGSRGYPGREPYDSYSRPGGDYYPRAPPPPPPRRKEATPEPGSSLASTPPAGPGGMAAAANGAPLERSSSLQSGSTQLSDSTAASSRRATLGSSMPRSDWGSVAGEYPLSESIAEERESPAASEQTRLVRVWELELAGLEGQGWAGPLRLQGADCRLRRSGGELWGACAVRLALDLITSWVVSIGHA